MVGPTGFVFVVGMGTSALFFATAVLIVVSAFRSYSKRNMKIIPKKHVAAKKGKR